MLKIKIFIAYMDAIILAIFGISLASVHTALSCTAILLSIIYTLLKIRKDFFTKPKPNEKNIR